MDIAVVMAYAAGMLLLGWFGMRRARSSEDFLVAGRSLGPSMYMGTMAATVLGGASTIGTVRLGYQYGISGLWLCASLGTGIIVLNLLLAKHLFRFKIYTINQALERKYNSGVKRVGAWVTFSYALMVCAVSLLAMGSIAQVILGIDAKTATILGGVIVVVYSTIGGMWSLTLTDMVQFIIKTIGMFFILLPITYFQAGGHEALTATLPESAFSLTTLGVDKIITYFVIYFFGTLIGQDIWQRVFTARSEGVVRSAGTVAGVYCLAYGVAGAVIGMSAHVLLPNLADPSNAFAEIANYALPPGVRGLVLAAALSAMMSTASAGLLAAATTFTEDLVTKKGACTLKWNRIITLVVGLCGTGIALVVNDVLSAMAIAYNLLVGGMLIPLLGAIYWKRSNSQGATAGMLTGFFTCVALMMAYGIDSNLPIYGSLVAGAFAFVVISLSTSSNPSPAAVDPL
jgi:SSS family solute:Na+ symporter